MVGFEMYVFVIRTPPGSDGELQLMFGSVPGLRNYTVMTKTGKVFTMQ